MEQLFFYIFAAIAVISAICVISLRNAVHSAVFLIVCLLQVAAVYILLRAPFLAAVQVFIYVGAVMVFFLFAVMVLDLGTEKLKQHIHSQGGPAVVIVAAMSAVLGYYALKGSITAPLGEYNEAALARNTEVIGRSLFTQYIFPFEVVSVVLLAALIGAVVLVSRMKAGGGR
ncbi:MAG: NADH-quinone oxidoreductase subunit J [Deltaproteobacteria bacterium]|nr:NADH-quinone oxidoreductase subunit J [Deltaproteobacteria bacterium]